MIPSIQTAINHIDPTAETTVFDPDDKDNFTVVFHNTEEIARSAIITKYESLITEYEAQLYARKRENDYPSDGDQWDMIYKDMLNSTTTHKDAVEAVKTKWPKNNKGPIE